MYEYTNYVYCVIDTEIIQNLPTLMSYFMHFNVQARFYEVVNEIYQIIIPIHVAKRQFQELEKIHVKLVECFRNIISKVT